MTQNPRDYVVVQDDSANICGALTWWTLSGSMNRVRLVDAWQEAELPSEWLPGETGIESALNRTMKELRNRDQARVKDGIRVMCRPIGPAGWCIVHEDASGSELAYVPEVRAWIRYKDGEAPKIMTKHCTPETTHWIHCQVDVATGIVDSNTASTWLASKMTKLLGMVSLRDRGGLYFIHREQLETWLKVQSVINDVSDHRIRQIPAAKTDDVIESVLDSVESEITNAAQQIMDELTADKPLNARSVRVREERCNTMLQRAARYESLLGKSIEGLTERINEARAALAAVALSGDDS